MAILLKYIEANINSDISSDEKIEQLIDILKISPSLSKTKDYDIDKVNDFITIILSIKVSPNSFIIVIILTTLLILILKIGW